MKARDFRDHCKRVAPWVDWTDTVDRFMFGDPESDVKGIAVTWIATDAVLCEAARAGLDFVISHEGAFYPQFVGSRSEDAHHQKKRELLGELGVTLMRCHDTWDRMPEFGIPDAWADFFGFPSEPRDTECFYKLCKVDGLSVADVARQIAEKTRPLGQSGVSVMGKLAKKVSRLAVGTGARTRLPKMYELGADIILATDDGTHTTNCGLWSLDLDIPVLIVNHATAELPGMMRMADYIRIELPGTKVQYLPCGFPCGSVTD